MALVSVGSSQSDLSGSPLKAKGECVLVSVPSGNREVTNLLPALQPGLWDEARWWQLARGWLTGRVCGRDVTWEGRWEWEARRPQVL